MFLPCWYFHLFIYFFYYFFFLANLLCFSRCYFLVLTGMTHDLICMKFQLTQMLKEFAGVSKGLFVLFFLPENLRLKFCL